MGLEIWTEKYRPKTLGEVVNQKHVVERLMSWVKTGSIPHLIFAGPAGTGKTTSAVATARDLFSEHWHENFQETNASDTRGIDVVRGRIKNFARTKPLGHDFKIIFLDESDSLTSEAQQALRRTMERFSNVCRFILSCNFSSRLIGPIQSRCVVFRFKNLSKEHVEKYLERIVGGEKLKIKQDGIDAIHELSGGDLRKATNLLQASATFGPVTKDVVYDVAAQAKPGDVLEMINYALDGNFTEARKKLYELLINQGLDGEDIIRAVHKQIFDLKIPEEKKLELIQKTGEFEFRLNQGGTPEIQLEALLTHFMNTKNK